MVAIFRAAVLVGLVVVGACKMDSGKFDDRACATDVECRPDQTCRSGLCAQNECATADDCGPGYQYACETGLCVVTGCSDSVDCGLGYMCTDGFCARQCAGADADGDNVCDSDDNCVNVANFNQADADGDLRGDACDTCANDVDNDIDTDTVCGDVDNCASVANTNQENQDGDATGDACDSDDDNDGVLDTADAAPLDPRVCGDSDADTCDDCAIGIDQLGPESDRLPGNDGPDFEADGRCDAGDTDDDGDGMLDTVDHCPLGNTGWTSNVSTDFDGDGCQDSIEDADDDNDGVLDANDPSSKNAQVCGDSDIDTCDDCAIGVDGTGPMDDSNASNDGTDTDGDGICNTGDPDDDNDTVVDGADTNPLLQFVCRDADTDGCDDCALAGGPPNAANDGADADGDGQCDASDTDDDNDGVADTSDTNPVDPFICRDGDGDTCDDCALSGGPPNTAADGPDTDGDGACNAGDDDDDNDGVADAMDPFPADPARCSRDVDADTCDDCAVGADGFGPLSDALPANDGPDTDGDGACNAGDGDDDGDTVADATDSAPLDRLVCRDNDGDSCDDCAVTGTPNPGNDGPDTDADGTCNAGDSDDDNDQVLDANDTNPTNPFACGDGDVDACDDCSVSGGPPNQMNDGTDTNGDGQCNASDTDDDGDSVLDGADVAPLDRFRCHDTDTDGCDDCAVVGMPNPTMDGTDTDMDGQCDNGDTDADGDTVPDPSDTDPLNNSVCQDLDTDSCDDCAATLGPPDTNNDGTDNDVDGQCDAGDTDDDNDGVADASDPFPADPARCGLDQDNDTCDDCADGVDGFGPGPDFDVASDGSDTDSDGACDAGDSDDDNDTVADGSDTDPTNRLVCRDADGDSCDDCAITGSPTPSNDGVDTDSDGACNVGDDDDDSDTVPDATDTNPLVDTICADGDGDTCDDCAITHGPPNESNDGADLDADGLCDVGDDDDDDDTVPDGDDTDSNDPLVCQDSDGDTCDDCSLAGAPNTMNDGPDADADGTCDDGEPCNQEILFVGAGVQATSNSSGATVTAAIPAGTQTNDLMIVFAMGRPNGSTVDPDAPPGWTKQSSSFHELGSNDVKIVTYYRFFAMGDTAPDFTVPSAWAGGGGLLTVAMGVWRGVDPGVPFDAGDVTSSNSASTTFTPTTIATATPNAWVVSAVATADANALALATANGFVARMTGTSYDTFDGGNGALGVADRVRVTVGGTSMPTWTQTAESSDAWAAITFALRPVNGKVCTAIAGLAGGGQHTCALLDSGSVRCWGQAASGQLGYGNTTNIGDTETPATAGDVSVGGTVVQVVAGTEHTCARLSTGKVRCWGNGADGRLGYGNTANIGDSETPASAGDVDLGGGTENLATQLAAGDAHTCALLASGAVRCWGKGADGRLGYGNSNNIGDDESPAAFTVDVGMDTPVEIAAGGAHTCVRFSTGAVKCWGLGSGGRLGYGNADNIGDDEAPSAVGAVSLGATASQLALGGAHSCARLTTNEVRCWGLSSEGQLGLRSTQAIGDTELPSSVDVVDVGGSVLEIAAGNEHTCARLTSGVVRCWGRGNFGALGYGNPQNVGDNEHPSTRGPVDLLRVAIDIIAGGNHTCALLDVGGVRCWGDATSGQLGYGNTTEIGDNEPPATVGYVEIE